MVNSMKTSSKLLSLLALMGAFSGLSSAADKPNVIVIMADDLGYGDVSCNGTAALNTPNIDRLAKEGLRFTSGYCSASTCTPTRWSFLTGTYAFRRPGTGIAPPEANLRIPTESMTLPKVMQQAGYKTAVIGKWHLGLGGKEGPQWNGELKPGPNEIGFDYCFLLPTTNDRVPSVYVENHRVVNLDPNDPLWVGSKKPSDDYPTGISHRHTLKMDWSHGHNGTIHNGIGRIGFFTGGKAATWRDEDLADAWVKQSVQWMESHKDEPFFLFFASHDLHVPRMPHERFQGKSGLGFRGDSILQLDWCVGELLRTLERLKLDKNTLIVFCSDNGPVLDDGYKDGAVEKLGSHKPSGVYSGGKYSIQEGGTRTPFITWWPGQISPAVSDQMVCTIDLTSSLAAMNHIALPAGECLDSFNVLDALLGKPDAQGRDHLVQQDNGNSGKLGYRAGKWKLQQTGKKKSYQLFDLTQDPAEKINVADKFPGVRDRMAKELEAIVADGKSRPGS